MPVNITILNINGCNEDYSLDIKMLHPKWETYRTYFIACVYVHLHKTIGLFGGPAFIQPIRAI